MQPPSITSSSLLTAFILGCGPDIKGESLADSGDTAPVVVDSGEPDDTDDTDDTDEPGPPPKGDVVVEYTVSWDFGDTIIEVCSSTLALTDVDTSHRTWTVWTDAGIDLDPHDLPNTAPESTPVGDGTTFNPGSHRFSVNQTTDPDLASYEAALVSGATPICLLASGNDLSLEQAVIPEPIPELVGALTEVGLRISVAWTDR